jgi:hypothetical protein
VIDSSRSICTTNPHMIPNQRPCPESKLNQYSENPIKLKKMKNKRKENNLILK